MERFKQYVMRYFEEIVVGIIFVTAFIGTYFIEEVSLILNLALRVRVWVISYLLEHTSEDLEPQVFLVS